MVASVNRSVVDDEDELATRVFLYNTASLDLTIIAGEGAEKRYA